MVRNAGKLYFPIRACIESLLPIVDEMVVALGQGDDDDDTLAQIEAIGSDKIKIYHRIWDERLFTDGAIYREETNYALAQCTGDWCIYLQADEVIHEADLHEIKESCARYIHDDQVEGLLFRYHHIYGDYQHEVRSHGWYAHEIRAVKNSIGVQSYKDAISFRINDRKMKVAEINARIFHYGWVRPPEVNTRKRNLQHDMYHGADAVAYHTRDLYQYGPLGKIDIYRSSHPAVMKEWMARFDWADQLDYSDIDKPLNRERYKHERFKYRFMSFIEKKFNGGRQLFAFKNWVVVRKALK